MSNSPIRQILDSVIFQSSADCYFKIGMNKLNSTDRVENLLEKEKIKVTSIFSFSHNVFSENHRLLVKD